MSTKIVAAGLLIAALCILCEPSLAATDLSFSEVHPKPFYQTSMFTFFVLIASMVAAGTITYFTFGAGAPWAASGVGTVASLIGGSGAGSYMAGLSLLGSWFGGNAMLGAAILNGISLGLGGGGAIWTSTTALGKAGVVASVAATGLDGVLIFAPPNTRTLEYRVNVPLPTSFGSKDLKEYSEAINDIDKSLIELAEMARKDPLPLKSPEEKEFNDAINEILKTKGDLQKAGLQEAREALSGGRTVEDMLFLAVISKNAGNDTLMRRLLEGIPGEKVSDRGYLDYLLGVERIQRGHFSEAEKLLRASWGANDYAVEQPILLINLLGHRNFKKNEPEIKSIVERAADFYDSDDYASQYSLLALYYRAATLYYLHKRFTDAEAYYRLALKEVPWTKRYLGDPRLRNSVQVGIANSLYGQGKKDEAQTLINELLEDTDDEAVEQEIKEGYAGSV